MYAAVALAEVPGVFLDQALELQQRLVVKHNVIQLFKGRARRVKTILDGMDRQARVVLLARKTLFLCGRDYLPVVNQSGSAAR